MTGRPARAADAASGRDSAVVQRWGWAIMFILVQTVSIAWWASRQTNIVEGLTKQVAAVPELEKDNIRLHNDVDRYKDDIARITAKYNRLLEYEGVVQLYESKIRELLVARGVRRSELPDPPKLPQD